MKNVLRIGKHSFNYLICQAAISGISFFLIPVYTHNLTTTDYGIIATFNMLINFFLPLFTLALAGSVSRFYFDFRDSEQRLKTYINTIIILYLIWSIFLFLLARTIFSDALESILKINFMLYIVPSFVIIIFSGIINFRLTLLQVREKSESYVLITAGQFLLITLGIIYLIVKLKMGAKGVITARLWGTFAFFIIILYGFMKNIRFKLNIPDLSSSLKFSLPLIPHMVSHSAMTITDRVFLNNYKGLDQTGIYSLGFNIASVLGMFIMAINLAWVPFLFDSLKTRGEEAKKDAARLTSYIMCFVVGAGLMLVLFNEEIVKIMAEQHYWDGMKVVPILVAGFLFLGLYYFNVNQLFYCKKTLLIPVITVSTAIANIALNYFLIPRFGIMGASVATMISYMIMFALTFSFAQRFFPLPYERRMTLPFLFAIVLLLFHYLFMNQIPTNALVIIVKLLEGLLYTVCVYFLFFIPAERKEILITVAKGIDNVTRIRRH